MTHYGMQSSNGRATAAEDIATDNAARSSVRRAAILANEAAKTRAANAGGDNSLSRVSAYDQYQQKYSPLDAFKPQPQQGPTPSGATVGAKQPIPAPTGALPGGKITPYGFISSNTASHGPSVHSGPIYDDNGQQTGIVSEPAKPFDEQGARADLYKSNPDIWKEGSEANRSFVAHVNQNGFQHAYENRQSILPSVMQPTATPTPVAATPVSTTALNQGGPAAGMAMALNPSTTPRVQPYAPPAPQKPEGNFTPYGAPTSTGFANAAKSVSGLAGRLYNKLNPYQ